MATAAIIGGNYIESDYLSLSCGFKVLPGVLYDEAIGARHEINFQSQKLLIALEQRIEFKNWRRMAKKLKVKDSAMKEFMEFLNDIGAISIKRNYINTIKILTFKIKNYISGNSVTSTVIRKPYTFKNLLWLCLRALKILGILSIINIFLFYASGFGVRVITIYSITLLIIITFSLGFHEYIHALLVKNKNGLVIVARGLRFGILHKPQTDFSELASAICGPVSGALVGAILILLVNSIIKLNYLGLIIIAITSLHLFGLLPSYGDGQVIKRILAQRKLLNES